MIGYLFNYRNSVDIIIEFIEEAKEYFQDNIIQKLYEELLYRIILIKLKEKNLEMEIPFSEYFIFDKSKLVNIFQLITDRKLLNDRIRKYLEDYKKISIGKFNDPFILRKDLGLVWKLTEGLAWCIYFMDILGFDETEINDFDRLAMLYLDKKENVYHDWPDFQSLKVIKDNKTDDETKNGI
jgi:hypothetical protein